MALEKYTHARADQTARALTDFSKSLIKLASLKFGYNCVLRLEYNEAPYGTANTEVIVFVERDEDGSYFFNNVKIDDLDEAIRIWSLACADVFKPIASDEKREDEFEEVGEESIPHNLQEIIDLYESPGLNDEGVAVHETDDDDDFVGRFLRESDESDEAEEEPAIYEEYDGQTLELKPPRGDDPSNDEVLEEMVESEQS